MKTIVQLLQDSTEQFADFPALLDLDGSALSFNDLTNIVKAMRSQLLSYGLGRLSRIALVLPDGLEMAAALLAVMCTGSVAPLNPKYRENELMFYLGDLKAEAVIVPQGDPFETREAAAAAGILALELEAADGKPGSWRLVGEREREPASDEAVLEDDIALILHTSGTTARPKMVPLRHRHLHASAANIAGTFQLSSNDRCLNVMPMFHIQGLLACLLAPLMAGASIVCTQGFKADRFFPWIERFQPTYYSASPTVHQAVIASASGCPDQVRRHRLRFIRSSAAALPPTVMLELEKSMQAPVIESYGMTEGALQSTSNPLPPGVRKPGSVGPAAGPQVAILDENGVILGIGVRGEVAMRGANVIDGYLENPEANRKAFVNGWFRTGDEGYLDKDGYLHLTGRLKEMINRGGEKVAPREVDEIFLAHPAVAQAVTFAVPHPTLGEDVAAAVVLKGGEAVSEKELRRYALERLSEVKAPSRILILDEVPKNAIGKLQRIGLYQSLEAHFQADYCAPRNALESRLAGYLEQLLGLERAGIHDNFFNLGGDSLLAAALSARVMEELKVKLSIAAIFMHPTVAEMAEYTAAAGKTGIPPGEEKHIQADILDYLSWM